MAEKDEIAKEEVEYKGLFNFRNVYSFAHTWLKKEGFGINEDEYIEKVDGEKRDIRIKWKAMKKVSDYFKIELGVEYEILGMSEVQVEIDGRKEKTNKGNITIKFKGVLVKDPEGKWETSPFYRFWRDVYNKFIIPSRVSAMEDEVKKFVTELKDEIKALLDIMGRRQ